MLQHEDYLHAATILWGDAGHFAVTEYERINRELYDGDMPPLPIVIGMLPYGACLAAAKHGSIATGKLPRITLTPEVFRGNGRTVGGANRVRDTIIHEMLHARLFLDGRNSDHNAEPWCEWITKLSPQVLGHPIMVAPVNPRRIDGSLKRRALDGHISRADFARWPYSLRPDNYDVGPIIDVDTA